MAKKRRHFGRVRRLPSGRWQARYPGPDGIDRPAPATFPTKADADAWLTNVEADMLRGEWRDPDSGRVGLRDFAERWVKERPGLAPRTVVLYDGLLRNHILPGLGDVDLVDITPARVRTWRQGLLDGGLGPVTVAKCYRLLKTVLNTAVDDELIRRNPCRIKAAGSERSPERPVVTVPEVYAVADSIRPWFRAMVLLAAFTGLRWGELIGLRRHDLDLDGQVVHVRRAVVDVGGQLVEGTPKTAAGRRDVAIPAAILPDLRAHLDRWSESGRSGRVFVGPKGAVPRRPNFQPVWRDAIERAGLPGLHFHDLRHSGNAFAARSANLRDLMSRMGHASTRAALIYQHTSPDREQEIGGAVSRMIEDALRQSGYGHVAGTAPDDDDGDGPSGVPAVV
jgi:integrase